MDIDTWLRGLKLSQYASLFRDRAIEPKDLEWLDDGELKRMGIAPRHRKQLLAAIGALNPLLDEGRASPRDEEAKTLGLNAQHRRMTVLFCDLVGSTALSTQLDAEALRDLVGAFHRVCAAAVADASGFVAQYVGDGLMAFFGYPDAHEDDAERAILAGLAIVDAVPQLKGPDGSPLGVRVGIATGAVVVGDLRHTFDRQERAIIGETPNLAARLQSLAQPNSIIIAASTHGDASEVFAYRRFDGVCVKGVAAPQTVFEVIGEAATGDPRRRAPRAAPPLSGRNDEIAQVMALWRRHLNGEPQALGLIGDAGLGKSRLLAEMRACIAARPHVWLESAAAQVFASRPFFAIARMIRHSLVGGRRASAQDYLDALTSSLHRAGLDAAAITPLIAEMIGVETPDRTAPLTANVEQRRALLIEALNAWIAGIAARFPTVLVVEDIHWADASTVELLERLINADAAPARPFVIYTSRDAGAMPAVVSDRHVQIALEPLDDDSLRQIIANTTPSVVSAEFMQQIVARAQGVPLFAVELALLLEKQAPHGETTIPDSLSALLSERLDRFGAARQIACVASVLGHDFWFRLLHSVAGGDARHVRASLTKLVRGGVLTAHGSGEETRYSFRHALLRDAAYDTLLRSQRRELHRRAAMTLTEEYPHLAALQPQLMAQHWTGAAAPARAVAAWRVGGDHARRARAFREAEASYVQALQILETLPATAERDSEELALQNALASIYQITKGYSAAATTVASARAHALAGARGDIATQVAQEVAAWAAQSSAGEYQAAAATAARAMQLARADGRPSVLAHGYMIQMTSHYRLGDLMSAEESFVEGSAFFEAPGFCRQPGAFAQTFGNAARVAWMMDDAEAASVRMRRALANAEACANPYDLAFAFYMDAILRVLTGEFVSACAAAAASIALSEEKGFPQFAAISRVALGRAKAGLGAASEGEALIRQGVEAMTQTRSRVAMTMYLTWLAEAQLAGGAPDRARASIGHALQCNPQELFYRPETLRLSASVGADPELARQHLRDAVALAKRMGAKLFHARALAAAPGAA